MIALLPLLRRLGAPPAVVSSSTWMEVPFSWDAVGSATSYQLEIGTTSGGSEYQVTNVGNVLTYTVNLPPGTYYSRVKAVVAGVVGVASSEYAFYV